MRTTGERRAPRRLLALTLAVCLLTLCLPLTASASDAVIINGVSTRMLNTGTLLVSAVKHGANANVECELDDFEVRLDGYPLTVKRSSEVRRGYIFVVDVSRYNVSSSARGREAKAFETIMTAIVDNVIGANDGARFLLAADRVTDVFGSFVPRSQASQGVTQFSSVHNGYATSNQADTVYLYDTIRTAVEIAKNDPSYDVYHIFVLSEGSNSTGGRNTPVGTIIREALQDAPCSIHTFSVKDTDADYTKFRPLREQLYQISDNVGGVYSEVDISDAAYNGNNVEDQVTVFIYNLFQNITHDMVMACDLNPYAAYLDRSSSHKSVITVTQGSMTAVHERVLPLSMVPAPAPTAKPTNNNSNPNPNPNPNPNTNPTRASSTAIPATPVPTPTATVTPPFATFGDMNSKNVRMLQQFLKDNYYYEGEIDGSFAGSTQKAYLEMCQVNAYDPEYNEENGQKTLWVSYPRYNLLVNSDVIPKTTPTPSPTPAPEVTPEPPFCARGDSGANVQQLQLKLVNWGFLAPDQNSGSFDINTVYAYQTYCQMNAHNIEYTEDNLIVSQARWRMMQAEGAPVTPSPTPSPAPTNIPPFCMRGDKNSENVRDIQRALTRANCYSGEINGDFDGATYSAYQAYCSLNGYTPELSETDSMVIISQERARIVINDMNPITPTPVPATPTPAPTAEPTATPAPAYVDLHKGAVDEGDSQYVNNLQARLKELDYYHGDDDSGTFGDATAEALKEFFAENEIEKDSEGDFVSAIILETYVFANTAKHAPEKSFADKIMDFLTGDQDIFGMQIPGWVIVLVIFLLVVAIVVLLIVLISRRKKANQPPQAQPQPPQAYPYGNGWNQNPNGFQGDQGATQGSTYYGSPDGFGGTSTSFGAGFTQGEGNFTMPATGFSPNGGFGDNNMTMQQNGGVPFTNAPTVPGGDFGGSPFTNAPTMPGGDFGGSPFTNAPTVPGGDFGGSPFTNAPTMPGGDFGGSPFTNAPTMPASDATVNAPATAANQAMPYTNSPTTAGSGFGGSPFTNSPTVPSGDFFNTPFTGSTTAGKSAFGNNAGTDYEATTPSAGAFTAPPSSSASARNVHLDLSFQGNVRSVDKMLDTSGIIRIGRRSDNDVVLEGDTTVSRYQCELFFEGSQLKVRRAAQASVDTFVDGQNIATSFFFSSDEDAPTTPNGNQQAAPVNSGSILTCGNYAITVTY